MYSPRLQSREYRQLKPDYNQRQPVLGSCKSLLYCAAERTQRCLRHRSIIGECTTPRTHRDDHGSWRRNYIGHLCLDHQWKSKRWRILRQRHIDGTLHLVRPLCTTALIRQGRDAGHECLPRREDYLSSSRDLQKARIRLARTHTSSPAWHRADGVYIAHMHSSTSGLDPRMLGL